MFRKLSRFFWRLKIVISTRDLAAWHNTRFLSNRPPTLEEIKMGQELAKKHNLRSILTYEGK